MKIANYTLVYNQPSLIIAETCSNIIRYTKSLPIFIETVAKSGAGACKIQLFSHRHFPEPEWESKRRVEFPRNLLPEFISLCHQHNLLAGASVFDNEAVDLLEKHGADFIKLATRETDNTLLWQRCLTSPLPKIASFDCTATDALPFANHTVHLACIPKYPTPKPTVPNYGKSLWGWSSHYIRGDRCLDILMAATRGACVIERHFALSETDLEAGWSSDPKEFREMVKDVRKVESMR